MRLATLFFFLAACSLVWATVQGRPDKVRRRDPNRSDTNSRMSTSRRHVPSNKKKSSKTNKSKEKPAEQLASTSNDNPTDAPSVRPTTRMPSLATGAPSSARPTTATPTTQPPTATLSPSKPPSTQPPSTTSPTTQVPTTTRPSSSVCDCSPRVYHFTFDFSLGCEPSNVDLGRGGLVDSTCYVTGYDDINVTDLVPVNVRSVQIIELGHAGAVAGTDQLDGDFENGHSFTYESISSDGVSPLVLQVGVLGQNSKGEAIIMQWDISFSNNCDIYPVLEVNDSIGWTVLTGVNAPAEYQCPAAGTS